MTEQFAESNGVETLVLELQGGDRRREAPCWVRAEAAGGPCKRPSVVRVYGFSFCEQHGTECKDGALEEFYNDADLFFEGVEGDNSLSINPEALRLIRAARLELGAKGSDTNSQVDVLRRAYPFRQNLMDDDFRDFDYAGGERMGGPDPTPPDWCWHQRMVVHKLMRLAVDEGADYLLEGLEMQREHVAAQLAYVLVDSERKRFRPAAKGGSR
jgi:hypothetical protein